MLMKLLPKEQHYNKVFAKDVRDFFSERRSGHVGIWRYSEPDYEDDRVNGMWHWGQYIKKAKDGNAYYVPNGEIQALNALLKNIRGHVKGDATVIDLGPGSEEALFGKVMPVLEALDSKSYIGVDIVPECLQRIEASLNANAPDIRFAGINVDFYQNRIHLPKNTTLVMAIFGQTIINLPIDPRVEKLPDIVLGSYFKRFYSHLNGNGYFIAAHDTNQNEADFHDAYMTGADFHLNMLYRIARDLPIGAGFDPNAFGFKINFFKETGAMAYTYVCKKPMTFELEGETFSLSKGQELYLHNSYKFKADRFVSIAQDSGFKVVDTQFDADDRVAVHLFKTT
jgi:uncharacterized SAM-dependent methyltransferase